MSGIMSCINIPGFMENADDLYDNADSEGEMWRDYVDVWHLRYTEMEVTIAELLSLAHENKLLGSLFRSDNARSQQTALGKALKKQTDRVYSGLKISRAPRRTSKNKTTTYHLEEITGFVPF